MLCLYKYILSFLTLLVSVVITPYQKLNKMHTRQTRGKLDQNQNPLFRGLIQALVGIKYLSLRNSNICSSSHNHQELLSQKKYTHSFFIIISIFTLARWYYTKGVLYIELVAYHIYIYISRQRVQNVHSVLNLNITLLYVFENVYCTHYTTTMTSVFT